MDALFDLVGTPFAYGGRGPAEYDCWGLLMECWRRVHGVELPDYRSSRVLGLNARMMSRDIKLWREVESAPGVGILLRIDGIGAHVGFQIDEDRMIHTWEESGGVTIEPLWGDWHSRIAGFYAYAP